jgi:hypothetical protein
VAIAAAARCPAAPFLALLALGLSRPVPVAVEASAELDRDRCMEGEDVLIRLRLDAGVRVDQLRAAFVVPSTVDFGPDQQSVVTQAGVSGTDLTVTIQARQWGRVTIGPVRVRLRTGSSTREAEVAVPVAAARGVPEPSAAKSVLAAQNANWTGDHPSWMMGEASSCRDRGVSRRRVKPGSTVRPAGAVGCS